MTHTRLIVRERPVPRSLILHDGGNSFLRAVRAREVWVHFWPGMMSKRSLTETCSVDGCDEDGYDVMIGFGPGTGSDPTSFTIKVLLCRAHAERAQRESTQVIRAWPLSFVLLHPIRFIRDRRR